MSQPKMGVLLAGSSSCPAIVGAALFWAWLDQCMFGPVLLLSFPGGVFDVASVVMLASSVVGLFCYRIFLNAEDGSAVWRLRPTMLLFLLGVVGSIACLVGSMLNAEVLFCAGSAAIGFSMGCLLVSWGLVAVAQGTARALLHISGAWGFGLVLNGAFFGFLLIAVPTGPQAWAASLVFPLGSAAIYALLCRRQDDQVLRVPHLPELGASPHEGVASPFGVRMSFLVAVLALCALFGTMTHLRPPTESGLLTVIGGDLVLVRCAAALAVFALCLLVGTHRVLALFRVFLSLVALGAITLTVSIFVPSLQLPGRLAVAAGYAGFDVLVWVVIASYAHRGGGRVPIVAAMAAEQLGILFGAVAGIGFPLSTLDVTATSVVLVALNYLLLVACYSLVRRYAEAPAASGVGEDGFEDGRSPDGVTATRRNREDAPSQVPLAAAVDALSAERGLTARETEVLHLLAEGRNVPYIAQKFVVSENTVKSHVRHIYEKCDFHDRQELLDALGKR